MPIYEFNCQNCFAQPVLDKNERIICHCRGNGNRVSCC